MKEKWKAKDVKDILTIINDQRYKIARDGSYKLSPVQARAILDLRLHRLTALGREDIAKEMKELAEKIKTFLGILGEQKKTLCGFARRARRNSLKGKKPAQN